ncbi:MAG TPA: ATP-binding cassette domain-containing protein, partial [Acidimicrobiales bacterium]|nr:ATP-binding cassette domain-containing protein [Acidimicrobiales bacterium]
MNLPDLSDPQRRQTAVRIGAAVVGALALVLLFPDAYPAPVILRGALLGTGTGLLGVGLVLTYRTTRIINFSYGAMGSLGASIGVCLHVAWDVPWLLAVPIAVASGAIIGAAVERLVIRRFRDAPRLVLTVASIGLAQLLGGLGVFVPRWFDLPAVVPSFETPLSDITWNTKQVLFNGNDLVLLAIVPAVLAGLVWFLLRSEEGVAVRGMAENMNRARLLGVPVHRLSLILWAITGALAALTVVLKAPNSGIPFEAAAGPAILLPALAAAVVAGFASINGAFFAGMGLGVLDQVVQWNFADRREVTNLFFLAVIVIALLLRKKPTSRALLNDETGWKAVGVTAKLPARFAALTEVRIARVVLLALLAGVLVYIPLVGKVAQVNYATGTVIFALAALSLVVVTGWGGVVNLGQFALAGVGGITAANLIADRNADLFVVIGASAVAGAVVALVIGLPALRVLGHYLGVTTLAFAVVMEQYVVKPALHRDLFPDVFERQELWGVVDLNDERWLYALCLAFLAATALLVHNLRRSRAGRVIIATRDNERMAAAAGISATEARLAGFVLAGAIAGVAGALYAVALRSVGEASFPSSASLLLFSMAVIGGSSSIGGTIAGVVLVRWLGWMFADYQLIVTGVGLLVILMVLPGGLAQAFERVRDAFAVFFAKRHGVPLQEALDSRVGADTELEARLETGHLGGLRNQRLLEAEGIEAAYGSFQVLFGVDVTVGRGEVVSLLGTNGAGKSTLLNTIGGLLPARGGRVIFDGHDITHLPAEDIAHLGLSLMPGGRGIFPTLTVAENMRLAGWMQRHDKHGARDALDEAL